MPAPSASPTDRIAGNLRPVDLRHQNPWWRGDAQPRLPVARRWLFDKLLERIRRPLAPVLLVRGPRQVGKTTLQGQLIEQLLADGTPPAHILRAQFDDQPGRGRSTHDVLDLAYWFEEHVLATPFNDAARQGQPAILFLDEVQNLQDWDIQIKQLVDHHDVSLVVTGSSALRIGLGRDSLAGRIQAFDLGTLRLTEIAELRGHGPLPPVQSDNGWAEWLDPGFWRAVTAHGAAYARARDAAFAAFDQRGAYPRSHVAADVPWPEVADQLNDTVVRRVIQHDLRLGERGRKRDPQLLEEVFRLACRYAGQSPSTATLAREAQARLHANVGPQRVRHYLDFLDSSLLLRTVQPLEMRLKKQRAPAKLCLCDHGVRAAWLQEDVPLAPARLDRAAGASDLAGHLVESILGYYLLSLTGPDVSYLPARTGQAEVDLVLGIGTQRIPIEIKYRRRFDSPSDVAGLTAFLDQPANDAPLGLVVTRSDTRLPALDPRIVPVALEDVLLVR